MELKKTENNLKISFINESYLLLLSDFIKVFLTLLTGLIAAKILGPIALGVTAACALVTRYGALLQLGILPAMGLEATKLISNKRFIEADSIINISLSGILVILFISIFISSIFFIYKIDQISFLVGVFCNMFGLAFFQIFNALEARAKFNFRIRHVAEAQVIFSFTNFLLSVVLINYIGLYGIFVASLISYIPSIIHLAFFRGEKVSFRWNRIKILSLIKSGSSIFIGGFCFVFTMSLDRFFILIDLGSENLGIYTAISSLAIILTLIPSKISGYFFQYLRDAFTQGIPVNLLWRYTNTIFIFSLLILLPMLLILKEIVSFVVQVYLFEYVEGLELVNFFLISTIGISTYHFCWAYLMAVDLKQYILRPQLLILFFTILVYLYIILFIDSTRLSFATGFLIINIFSSLVMILSIKISGNSLTLKQLFVIASAIVACGTMIFLYPAQLYSTDLSIISNLILLSERILISFVIFIIILFAISKSSNFTSMKSFLKRDFKNIYFDS